VVARAESGEDGERGDRVDEEHRPGVDHGDQEPGQCGSDDPGQIERQRVEGDRIRELLGPDHLDGERLPNRGIDRRHAAQSEREKVNPGERRHPGHVEHAQDQRTQRDGRLGGDEKFAFVEPVGQGPGR
jgi:hypothetical protein